MKRRWFAVVLSTLLAAGLLDRRGSNSLSASKDAVSKLPVRALIMRRLTRQRMHRTVYLSRVLP